MLLESEFVARAPPRRVYLNDIEPSIIVTHFNAGQLPRHGVVDRSSRSLDSQQAKIRPGVSGRYRVNVSEPRALKDELHGKPILLANSSRGLTESDRKERAGKTKT